MFQVDLSLRLADSLLLRHPLWVASAHYSYKESVIRQWKDVNPAALTLKTSHIKREEEEKRTIREQTLMILPRFGRSFYCDGPKQEELLTYPATSDLLKFAQSELPETAVGISVLANIIENYGELAKLCQTAAFCELNLKYSFRIKGAERKNYLKETRETFDGLIHEVEKFTSAFSKIPVLVKLSRELSWLPGTDEMFRLFEVLKRHGRASLIVANSLQMDVAPFVVGLEEKLLSGGVMCGERLFDDTIKLITSLRPYCREYNLPIVASGGMITPEQILTAFRAGADAIQLCTAFVYNGLDYYQTLCWNLHTRMEIRGLQSLSAYVDELRQEGVNSIYSMPFMYFPNFWDGQFQKHIQADVRKSKRFDFFLISGKTLSENWHDALKFRFEKNRGLRLVFPKTTGGAFLAIHEAWGLTQGEISGRRDRAQAAHASIKQLWAEAASSRQSQAGPALLEIFETERPPLHSFYLFDDKVYVAPYPLNRPSELGSPVYVFVAGSVEFTRIDQEATTLIGQASRIYPQQNE